MWCRGRVSSPWSQLATRTQKPAHSQACGGLPASSLPSEEPPPITGSALLVAVVKPTELFDLQHYFPNNYNNNKTTHEHCEHWAGWFSSGCLILKSHIYYKNIVIYYFHIFVCFIVITLHIYLLLFLGLVVERSGCVKLV